MRYKISENVQFIPASTYADTKSKPALKGQFVITDKVDDRFYIVNETTRLFIEKFNIPRSFKQVAEEIGAEVGACVEDITKLTRPFFKYIKYRQFIVPENYKVSNAQSLAKFNVGDVLDKYKIEQVLGVNGDVDVYKATDISIDNIVVIKLIKNITAKAEKELEREFCFLQNLNTYLVAPAAYEFERKTEFIYFTQEHIEGLSLPEFIHRNKRQSKDHVFSLVFNILKTFKKIHDAGIIHGDIHPGNIIISKEEIKVIDFGLAINNELDKNEVVNFGGAYYFMPPERIKKTTYKKFRSKPDFFSDIFQLGIVLYMLMFDRYPFNGLTWEELASEIKEKPIYIPSRSKYGFLIPAWFKEIIEKCVIKKPSQRFADAGELFVVFCKSCNNARKTRSAIKV